jgi:hypothetical protein
VSNRRTRHQLLTTARVRKARRDGSCVLCPRPIAVGQNVGLIAAGWAHLSPCIVGRRLQLVQPAAQPEE